MDLCPYGLPGPLFTRGQALQCMKWTFSSPELPELINLLLRPGQSFWETRSIGLCIPQASLCLASRVSVQEKSVSSSIYLWFGIGGGRSLGKREGIEFPKSPCCQQLPGTRHGRKPTQSCWRCLGSSCAEGAHVVFSISSEKEPTVSFLAAQQSCLCIRQLP